MYTCTHAPDKNQITNINYVTFNPEKQYTHKFLARIFISLSWSNLVPMAIDAAMLYPWADLSC